MNYFKSWRLDRLFDRSAWKSLFYDYGGAAIMSIIFMLTLIFCIMVGISKSNVFAILVCSIILLIVTSTLLCPLLIADDFFETTLGKETCKIWIYKYWSMPTKCKIFIKSKTLQKNYLITSNINYNSVQNKIIKPYYKYFPYSEIVQIGKNLGIKDISSHLQYKSAQLQTQHNGITHPLVPEDATIESSISEF